jgi:hypothetical protein
MDKLRAAFAIVVIVAFAIFAVFLVSNADTQNQSEWERWVYVFGAVEAIVFAAVGWFFGREVHRERAEKAEERAKEAEQEKVDARDKGSKLAGMVVASEGGHGGPAPLEEQAPMARGRGGGGERRGEGGSPAVEYAKREYGL